MIYTLKYASHTQAVEDLTAKGIITENGFGEGIQAVVYNGFKKLMEGDEETEPTFGTDYLVVVMSDRVDLYFENRVFDASVEAQFGIVSNISHQKKLRLTGIEFGKNLLLDFLGDMDGKGMTPEQVLATNEAMWPLREMAEIGNIEVLRYSLNKMAVNPVYSQVLKEKYVAKCDEFLIMNL